MRHIQQSLAACLGFLGLVLWMTLPASAETLYLWKDRNGTRCYSNVAPPDGVAGYSTLTAAPPATGTHAPVASSHNATTGENIIEVPADSKPDPKLSALQQRIDSRKASIHHIESLLKLYPKDPRLRKHLYQQKRYLHEDSIRLKLREN